LSPALGRAIAASQGKELWQLIREMAAETMAKFVAANSKNDEDLAKLMATDFDELRQMFRNTAAEAIKEQKPIYELLREQLEVYPV